MKCRGSNKTRKDRKSMGPCAGTWRRCHGLREREQWLIVVDALDSTLDWCCTSTVLLFVTSYQNIEISMISLMLVNERYN
jgi:hypothetical protein